jgi:hypothetical protein
MSGAYRSGGIMPAPASAASARTSAASSSTLSLAMKVTAQFPHAMPRTVHRSQSMVMSFSCWLAIAVDNALRYRHDTR